MESNEFIQSYYQCFAKSQTIQGSSEVIHVTGDHDDGMSNNDVIMLEISQIKCSEMPSKLSRYFPNIKGISAWQCGIEKLTKNDLETYPKLQFLDMSDNKIAVLTNDVFEKNRKITWVNFIGNRLFYIGLAIFDSLENLEKVYLLNNLCINMQAEGKYEIAELKDKIASDCSERVTEAEEEQDKVHNLKEDTTVRSSVKSKHQKSEDDISLKAENENLHWQISNLRMEIKNLKHGNEAYESRLISIDDDLTVANEMIVKLKQEKDSLRKELSAMFEKRIHLIRLLKSLDKKLCGINKI